MRHARFLALVRSFPVLLEHAPTVNGPDDEVDLLLIDAWAAGEESDHETIKRLLALGCSPFPGDGAREAVRFVLNLFDSRRAWKCGAFSIGRALRVWDHRQLSAFQSFVNDPFLP